MQRSSPSVESSATVPQTGGFIALVDDDLHILDVLSTWVQSLGLDACSFDCAEDLLDSLQTQTSSMANLVGAVLDVNLKKMHGIELAHHLRQNFPNIPLVLITALNAVEVAQLGQLPPRTTCLKKPFDLDVLKNEMIA